MKILYASGLSPNDSSLYRLWAGCGPADALAQTVGALAEHQVTGRFNFLLSNGEVIAATAAGDTLCYRLSGGGVVVASEPGDDEPGWIQVSDQCVLTATPGGVDVRPLPGPAPPPAGDRTQLATAPPAEERTITR